MVAAVLCVCSSVLFFKFAVVVVSADMDAANACRTASQSKVRILLLIRSFRMTMSKRICVNDAPRWTGFRRLIVDGLQTSW